ncbi:MAG: hypothetical protein AB1592_11390 [Pseudomonadota bacterium]
MDFRAIDKRRQDARISQYRLCREADVHPTTYQRLLKKPAAGLARTLRRLDRALTALVEKNSEKGKAA